MHQPWIGQLYVSLAYRAAAFVAEKLSCVLIDTEVRGSGVNECGTGEAWLVNEAPKQAVQGQ